MHQEFDNTEQGALVLYDGISAEMRTYAVPKDLSVRSYDDFTPKVMEMHQAKSNTMLLEAHSQFEDLKQVQIENMDNAYDDLKLVVKEKDAALSKVREYAQWITAEEQEIARLIAPHQKVIAEAKEKLKPVQILLSGKVKETTHCRDALEEHRRQFKGSCEHTEAAAWLRSKDKVGPYQVMPYPEMRQHIFKQEQPLPEERYSQVSVILFSSLIIS